MFILGLVCVFSVEFRWEKLVASQLGLQAGAAESVPKRVIPE